MNSRLPTGPVIRDFKSTKPVIKLPAGPEYKKLEHLIPTTNIAEVVEFSIADTNTAFVNAIRRIIIGEIAVKSLYMAESDLTTDDCYIIQIPVAQRIWFVYVKQSIPDDAKFSMYVKNTGTEIMEVKVSEIKGLEKYANTTGLICTLRPGKFVSAKNIYVRTASLGTFANFSAASAFSMIPTDVTPLLTYEDNPKRQYYTGKGEQSTASAPRSYNIRMVTHGTIDGRELLSAAAQNLIDRLNHILELINTFVAIGQEHVLRIDGETHTTGVLLVKTIMDMYTDIEFCTYNYPPDSSYIELRIKHDDPRQVATEAIKYAIDYATEFKHNFI